MQGEKFDPRGDYVRRWVPELARMPEEFVHHPWDAPALVLSAAGVELGANYPRPIVDEPSALAAAKEKLYALRQTREAHAEASAIQHKHGSRKSGLPPTASRKRFAPAVPDGQGQLF